MVIRDDMAVEGSVSGGCVESVVIEAGIESLATGTGQRLDFGVADARAWEVGLSCGGRIAVLVTPVAEGGLPASTLDGLAGDIAGRRDAVVSLDAANGVQLQTHIEAGSGSSALSDDESSFTFRQVPPRRIIVVGGVHITQFLARWRGRPDMT